MEILSWPDTILSDQWKVIHWNVDDDIDDGRATDDSDWVLMKSYSYWPVKLIRWPVFWAGIDLEMMMWLEGHLIRRKPDDYGSILLLIEKLWYNLIDEGSIQNTLMTDGIRWPCWRPVDGIIRPEGDPLKKAFWRYSSDWYCDHWPVCCVWWADDRCSTDVVWWRYDDGIVGSGVIHYCDDCWWRYSYSIIHYSIL